MSQQVFFIGPLGKVGGMTSGDSLKNLHLTRQLQKLSVNLNIIDTNYYRQSPWLAAKAVWSIIKNRKGKFIVSASTMGAYKMLSFMKTMHIKDVTYWVVGGDFPNLVHCHLVSVKPYANARTIIVEGRRMEETLRIAGLDNVTTLPNFKPIDFIPAKQPRVPGAPMKFVFLSRIDEDKGCGYINRAAELLNEKGLADKYTIDYYGAVADRYKEKFTNETNRLPNVAYKGFLNLLDKSNYELLASYDAMLFPTFFYGEGFAGIFIDAFIAGLPVITTDWSLNSEIVTDGETGIIVQNRSAEKLAEAMEYLIRHPEEAERMGRRCQEQCRKYDTDQVVTPQFLKRLGLL